MAPTIDAKTALERGTIHEIAGHIKIIGSTLENGRSIKKTKRSDRTKYLRKSLPVRRRSGGGAR